MAEPKRFKVGEAPWEKEESKAPTSFKVGQAPWEIEEREKKKSNRPFQAALEGVGKALTLGYLPQIQAGAQRVLEPVFELATGKNVPDQTYLEARDQFIRRSKGLQETNPTAMLAGEIGGGIAMPLPGLGAAGGLGAKMLRAGAVSGGLGLVSNPGDVEGQVNPLQVGERIQSGLVGGALGAAGQGLVGGVSKGLKAFSEKGKGLEDLGARTALKSLGAKTPELRKLQNKGKIEEVGKFAVKEGLVGPGMALETSVEKSKDLLRKTAQEMTDTYKAINETVNSTQFLSSIGEKQRDLLFKTELNPSKIADDVLMSVESSFKGKATKSQAVNAAQNALASLKELGENAQIDDLLNFRRSVDDLINFDRAVKDSPASNEALKQVRRSVKDVIDKRIDAIEKATKGSVFEPKLSGVVEKLKNINKRYSTGAEVDNVLRSTYSRERAKLPIGLPDLLVSGSLGSAAAFSQIDPNDPNSYLKALAAGVAVPLAVGGGLSAARRFGPGLVAGPMMSTGRLLQRDPLNPVAARASGLLDQVSPERLGLLVNTLRGE